MTSLGYGGEEEEDDDRISRFPDHLLHHILSFLPTIDAARTSVLSRGWRHIWASSEACPHVLDFDGDEAPFRNRPTFFKRSIDCVLAAAPDVRCIRLAFNADLIHPNVVERWVEQAGRRHVQELRLHVRTRRRTDDFLFKLPSSSIFCRCPTLKVLELDLTHCDDVLLPHPPSIRLDALEKMHLKGVRFPVDSTTTVGVGEVISSCCPSLKEWKMDRCSWRLFSRLDVNCPPSLEELDLRDCSNIVHLSVVAGEKLQRLSIVDSLLGPIFPGGYGSLKISAPGLRDFVLEGSTGDYSSTKGTMTTLDRASVSFFGFDGNDRPPILRSISKLFRSLVHAKHLTLKSLSSEEMFVAERYNRALPAFSFHNLEVLILESLSKYNPSGINWLLERCPNIKTLDMTFWGHNIPAEIVEDHEANNLVHNPFLSDMSQGFGNVELKLLLDVKIHGFTATKEHISFVKFLLRNASSLKDMTIMSLNGEVQDLKKIVERQLDLEVASPGMKLLFR